LISPVPSPEQAPPAGIVLDTNVFVAAGFKPRSRSAKLVELCRNGRLHLRWSRDIRREIEHTVRRIPVLPNSLLDGLFRDEHEFIKQLDLEPFAFIEDPADRKFAALATELGATLITTDDHLLRWRDRFTIPVIRPSEFPVVM
jgi:uncharacterized protein